MKSEKAKYEGFLIASSFIWGTSFVSAKIGVEHLDPFLFSVLRFLLGSLVLVLALVVLRRFDARIFRDKMIWGVAGINAVALELQHLGMTMTTATNAVLLIDINVVFVAILAAFVLAEKITRKIVLGLVIGLVGVAVIATNGDLSSIYTGSFLGNATVFLAGLLWAFYIVYQKKLLVRESDVLLVTGAVILLTTIILLPLTFIFTQSYAIDGEGAMSAIYTGLFCTGLAFLLYNIGLKGMGATITSIILLLEIVFAMIFAFLVLGEAPTAITAIGGALIVLSIVTISFGRNGREGERERI
ncbi:MAG: DMT family transporter [Euryarchaeota archaeon]|nr:DMT family transporter [Euryarchaeota archaeon]